MGLVRDRVEGDAEALAQWVMRKIRNHDPMRVREAGRLGNRQDKRGRSAALQEHTDFSRKDLDRFKHTEGMREVEYCLQTGQRFKITVEEIGSDGNPIHAEG